MADYIPISADFVVKEREVLAGCLHDETLTFLQKLDDIWGEIGFEQEERKNRGQAVLQHVRQLYSDIVAEAEEQKLPLINSVKSILKELHTVGEELKVHISLDGFDSLPLLSVRQHLRSKYERYQEKLSKRTEKIKKLEFQEKELCTVLGKCPKCLLSSPLPSEEDISRFKNYLEDLQNEVASRKKTFQKTQALCSNIMNELNIKPNLHFEILVIRGAESDFKVTDENMALLEDFHTSLKSQMETTRFNIAELRERLTALWERLEESPQVRSAFMDAHTGNSVQTYEALKTEVARCEKKKKENIQIFVKKIRQDLMDIWKMCYFTEEQKSEFQYMQSDCYTEDLLTLHEMELEKLQAHYNNNLAIFELLSKREQLWKKMLDLEKRANRPDRYKNRGGQLLKEEKERNSVQNHLPKIEEELLKLVGAYEAKTGKRFTVHGQLVLDLIQSAWEDHKENRHIQLSAKKQEREFTKTPNKSPMPHTTSRLTPLITPVLKRKLFTPLFGGATPKKNTPISTKKLPKIQVNGSTIRRVSLERKKRCERRRASRGHNHSSTKVTHYDSFRRDLETKPACRSTQFLEDQVNLDAPGCSSIKKTPKRTPNHTLRSRSPNIPGTSRLATTPGNLPIIL